MARMRIVARSSRNYSGSGSNNETMWFGISLGIVAFLILACAFLIEGRRFILKRQKKAKEAQKRKEQAVRELEMQAEMFVKSHLDEDGASTKITDRTPEYSDDEVDDYSADYNETWVNRNGNRT